MFQVLLKKRSILSPQLPNMGKERRKASLRGAQARRGDNAHGEQTLLATGGTLGAKKGVLEAGVEGGAPSGRCFRETGLTLRSLNLKLRGMGISQKGEESH